MKLIFGLAKLLVERIRPAVSEAAPPAGVLLMPALKLLLLLL
jgi:hypothetical protein